jgi:hypothetical protein
MSMKHERNATMAKPKPFPLSRLAPSQMLLLGLASQGRSPGRGTGRLRLGKQSEPEHAQPAIGGGAA